ncbi:hypothetical protein, partial [Profundibacter sp.]
MRVKKSFAGILIGLVAFANSAFATNYKCNIRANGLYGGIPSVLVFSVNDSEDSAVIYYALIKKLYDRPIEAELVVANPKRYTFKWRVAVPVNGSKENFITDYRATYIKRTHRISVRGFPRGAEVDVGGTGS